jgi:hypothetical protein
MSPIPEFTDALSESTKSCDTSVMKVTEKKDTETDRNPVEVESDKDLAPLPEGSEDTSRSAADNTVSGDADLEKPSEISGSPVEEHWLEVSVSKYNFVCDHCNNFHILQMGHVLANASIL